MANRQTSPSPSAAGIGNDPCAAALARASRKKSETDQQKLAHPLFELLPFHKKASS